MIDQGDTEICYEEVDMDLDNYEEEEEDYVDEEDEDKWVTNPWICIIFICLMEALNILKMQF